MEPCQIFLFGDLTVSFEEDLRQLLHVVGNGVLGSFLDQVGFTLREEFGRLSAVQQNLLPRFTTLIDLLHNLKGCKGAPALKSALLCLYQIGQFIRYYGEGSRPFPNAQNSYLVSICTGSFAAAAISTSQTLSELVPAGVEAVLVAFKTGLRSLEVRDDVETPIADASRSWSVVLSIEEAQATKIVETFVSKKSLPPNSRPYLSSISPKSVTISGPPSLLKELVVSIPKEPRQLLVESPYHAPHLFGSCDVDEIVGELYDDSTRSRKPRIALFSATSGNIIAADNFQTLLRKVVSEALCEQLRWDNILKGCADEVFQQKAFKECLLCPVTSNAAQFVHSRLSRDPQVNITINDFLNPAVSGLHSGKPTGKFEQSKIAIIGFSGRFPESASTEEFWELLHAGRDVHRTIPEDRFNWKTHFDATGKSKNTSKVQYGCFIKEPGIFDARFFNMSPRESENTDPAQRLAITTTYEAMEMAGMVLNRTPSTQQDRIGVFFGTTSDDWREVNSGQDVDTYFIPGGNRAFVPGRISYFFRFCGPSISMDTACSSSFAAIQTACSYLWKGDVDTAVAGGTNVLTNPDNFAGLDRGHFLSTTGNCNTFDDAASGYCRSDAVGSVILKRLEDAQADNDPIFGVIAGATTNHCGQTDSITRPHEGDQLSVFNRIMRHANVNPIDVSYIEMHGTGTQAGDATEMNSVLSAFVPGRERTPRHPLYLGSAKANIGHAESASGVSSLIKVLTMMKKNEIPPHCGIKTKINHNYPLDLNERNVNIAFQPKPWHRTDCVSGKRTVFLNNFSAAGGNTAVLLEDAPLPQSKLVEDDHRTMHVITITAKTAKSLQGNINAMINFLQANPTTSLSALSYTTTARRMQHSYRTLCSGSDVKSLEESLAKKLENSDIKPIPNASKVPRVAFVFTGQGSTYTGIGKQLFESMPSFRADIQRFDNIALQQGFPSFLHVVKGTISDIDAEQPITVHLALTCVQMALSRLWKSWGVLPVATIGHSLGEYAALYAAGVLTPSNVIYLVGTRAQLLLDHCKEGSNAMLAVKAPLDDIEPQLAGSHLEIACMNQPTGNVISGPSDEINSLTDKSKSLGQDCVKLDIPYAFHSAQVDPILDEFEAAASSIRYNTPIIPYISPLTGQVITDDSTLGASYLTHACREAVNFEGALKAAQALSLVDERTIWLEFGSHPLCSGMIKGSLGSQTRTCASLKKSTDTWRVIATALETLYLNGIDVQWNEYHRDFTGSHRLVELPRYSWDLKNYWIQYKNDFCLNKGDMPEPKQIATAAVEQKSAALYLSPSVQRVLEAHNAADISTLLVESDINDLRLAPVIQGHKVNTVALCPSSLYADIAMTIAEHILKSNNVSTDSTGFDCADMKVERPLIAGLNTVQILRVSASMEWRTNVVSLAFYSINAQGRKTADHATCKVVVTAGQAWAQDWKRNSYLVRSRVQGLLNSVDHGNSHKMKRGLVYKLFSALVDYSSDYQGMQEVVLDSDELEATAQISFNIGEEGFHFNPCWIDSLGHIAGFIMNGNDNVQSKDQVFVNHGWDKMRCSAKFTKGKTYRSYNKMQLINGTLYGGDTYIFDEDNIVAIYEGVKFQGVPRHVLDQLLPSKPGPAKNVPKASPPTARKADKNTPTKSQPAPTKAPKGPKADAKASSPTSNISRVMKIVSDEAGIDLAELTPTSDFSDFGIDSLMSLTISGRIQEELSLDLPPSLFAEYPTVKEFTAFLTSNESESISPDSSSDEDQPSTPGSDDSSGTLETSASSVTAAEGDVLGSIRATIVDEIGIAIEDLKPSTSFLELGMDSLLTLNIMGKLSEDMEMDLPRNLLADNDNMNEVQKALGLVSEEPTKDRSLVDAAQKVVDSVPDSPPLATSVLLQGNPSSASRTLFLFPDGSGSATSYASLPKISPNTAVYGLNCPWQKTPQDMKCSFEAASAKYLIEIRRRQPQGPYYFGGWSAGGILAYETAQQLARNGEETARLILIDSPNPVGLENPPERMYDFFDTLDFFGTNDKPPPSWLRPHFNAFLTTLDNYKVRPFNGTPLQTHIVYAKDGICKHPNDPRPEIRPDDPREMLWLLNNRTDFSGSGWGALVGVQNLKVHVLNDVNHFSLVAPGPKIQELSAFIKRAMD